MEDWMRKHSKISVLLLGFVLVVALTGMAQQKQADETVKCAVGGTTMKKSEAKASVEYNGKTYYFCCDNCKATFLKNPEKYANGKEKAEHMHEHGEATEEHMHSHGEEDGTVVDPVCGMKIKKSDAKATIEHNGMTYYFCMEGCAEKFKANPEKYVKKSEEMVTCPVSGKEIKKSDASGSHEYNGKTYYFCCPNCKEKFLKDPAKYAKQKDEAGILTQGTCATCATKKIK
jgi:YHS domain-containing protein